MNGKIVRILFLLIVLLMIIACNNSYSEKLVAKISSPSKASHFKVSPDNKRLAYLSQISEKNIISEIKPLLDEMIIKGRWYSTSVHQTFLERAGEL